MAKSWPPQRDETRIEIEIRDRDRYLRLVDQNRKAAVLIAAGFGASSVIASIGALMLNHWFLFVLALISIVALTLFAFFSFPISQRLNHDYIRHSSAKESLEAELHELKSVGSNE